VLIGAAIAIIAVNTYAQRYRIINRASHWPSAHYPVPFLLGLAAIIASATHGLSWIAASFYWVLFMPLVVFHFAHDCIQKQGFPVLSLSQDTAKHYRLSPSGFRRVPKYIVVDHYEKQFSKWGKAKAHADADRRTNPVTVNGLLMFLAAAIFLFVDHMQLYGVPGWIARIAG
jgi:hypothetical protein